MGGGTDVSAASSSTVRRAWEFQRNVYPVLALRVEVSIAQALHRLFDTLNPFFL